MMSLPPRNPTKSALTVGFTLIEMSIVLVIIGLIVGGVLVGRSLIHAAELRSTVTQIQKFKTAVNTFQLKFSSLPGDIQNPGQFGLTAVPLGGSCAGDGLIDDYYCHSPAPYMISGESSLFWVHLSADTHLIEGSYIYTGVVGGSGNIVLGTSVPVLPIGGGLAVQHDAAGLNWFTTGLQARSSDNASLVSPGMTPYDALAIDSKIDDGMPNTGSVEASLESIGGGANIVVPIDQWGGNCAFDGSSATTPGATYRITGTHANTLQCNLRFPIQ